MAISTARCFVVTTWLSRGFQLKDSLRILFSLLIFLAFASSVFHLFYVCSSPELYHDHHHVRGLTQLDDDDTSQETVRNITSQPHEQPAVINPVLKNIVMQDTTYMGFQDSAELDHVTFFPPPSISTVDRIIPPTGEIEVGFIGNNKKNKEDQDVFHDRRLFMEEYKQMNKSLKIYVYPHKKDDPFANVMLPMKSEPGGNYASEAYFKKALFKSHLLTNDPSKADLFYLPFSIATLRNDKRVGVGGIQDFVKNYILNISRTYPFWNRTGGADHFYVACHSVGRTAMENAVQVKLNAIQLVCSSSYFLSGYIPHKDASIPQIWPRKGTPPTRSPSQRKNLAFYAGAMNSREREFLVKTWGNDTEISVHRSRLKTPYSEALLGSKFCIHAKGFEVNTARIGDALYYGCVPVVLADHYDLPFADILNWSSFSVVLPTVDIPMLKKTLKGIVSANEYVKLQENVMRVKKHFQWHDRSVDYDTFYMAMYELWLRRSHVRIPWFD